MNDVYVYVVDMPMTVREMVAPCPDGYTVYINARLSDLGKLEAYSHALRHITNEDFRRDDVQTIEHEAHGRKHEESSNLHACQFGEAGT